ncbi:MAG: methyltransferase domain-containing protein [Chloroflexi bacterium]|nr:methyltransferase domain-containing protein [Chloroflexota bacterium]
MSSPEQSVSFDRAATYYDQTRGFPAGIDLKAAALMAQTAGITRDSQVIEIGVGTGRLALPLAQHSGRYYGVDLSAAMMDVLRSKQPAYPDGDIRLTAGDVMRLPLKSGSIDFAVMVHILHLIPDPQAAVRELARVLKPGGAAVAGWNWRREPTLEILSQAWGDVTGDFLRHDRRDTAPETLEAAGWRLRRQDGLQYSTTMTATQKIEAFRGRIYSSLWRLPDEVWRAGVEAMEKALAEHYPDPDAPQPVEHTFFVAVYERP